MSDEPSQTVEVDMMQSAGEGDEDEDETDSATVWGHLFALSKGFAAQGVSSPSSFYLISSTLNGRPPEYAVYHQPVVFLPNLSRVGER